MLAARTDRSTVRTNVLYVKIVETGEETDLYAELSTYVLTARGPFYGTYERFVRKDR